MNSKRYCNAADVVTKKTYARSICRVTDVTFTCIRQLYCLGVHHKSCFHGDVNADLVSELIVVISVWVCVYVCLVVKRSRDCNNGTEKNANQQLSLD